MKRFSISIDNDIATFKNNTDLYVEVSYTAEKPKRKPIPVMDIKPGSYVIHDKYRLDLSRMCFRFLTREEALYEGS